MSQVKMGGDGSATGGCRQQHNAHYLIATLSVASGLPPPLRSVTSRFLDFYHECVDNGGWARVLYDTRDGLEKLIICRIPPRLLLTPLPLLRNASLDARQATGGGHATEGGGRRGLRGGVTARSPAFTPHP